MQAPPRRDDKPTIRFRFSIGMSTGQITIKRAEHQRLITFTVWQQIRDPAREQDANKRREEWHRGQEMFVISLRRKEFYVV